jgi:hypothetical protein
MAADSTSPGQPVGYRPAIHEAGHAVVAIKLGFRIEFVRLDPAKPCDDGCTRVSDRPSCDDPAADRKRLRDYLIVVVAGHVAAELPAQTATGSTGYTLERFGAGLVSEQLLGGHPFAHGNDVKEAFDYAARLTREIPVPEPLTLTDPAVVVIWHAEEEARGILRVCWDSVLTIAESLRAARSHSLTGEEAAEAGRLTGGERPNEKQPAGVCSVSPRGPDRNMVRRGVSDAGP